MFPATDIDIGLAPASRVMATQAEWHPLDRARVMRHFRESLRHERVDRYLQGSTDLLPNEKVILFWLAKVYGDSMSTIELYARYAVQFLNHAHKDFHLVGHMEIDAFMRHLKGRGAKPATVNTVGATLKSFFRAMVDARFMQHNPTAFMKKTRNVRQQTLPGHLTHSFSETEMDRLLSYMAGKAPIRDYALVQLLYMTGLRALEACALTWGDLVQWQDGWYLDVIGKGTKARRVYVPASAMQTLTTYRQAAFGVRPGDMAPGLDPLPVFPHQRNVRAHLSRHGVFKLIKRWVREGLGKDASPHWFRHTCFTQQRLKGATLEAIQAGAGHASLDTTMQYNEAAALMEPAGKVFERR